MEQRGPRYQKVFTKRKDAETDWCGTHNVRRGYGK